MVKKKQTLAVCLLIALVLIDTYLIMLDTSQFFRYSSASLNFTFQNQTNRTLNFTFFLYIGSDETFNFNGSETTKLVGNFSVSNISDGSGVRVYCNSLAPSEDLSFVTQDINITPLILQGLENVELNLNFVQGNLNSSKQYYYDALISLLNNQGRSIASRYYFTVGVGQNGSELVNDDRNSFGYFIALIVVVTVLFIGMAAMITWHSPKWFPIITLSIVFLTLFLYVFVGSSYEISDENWSRLFVPLLVFIQGYDWHIFGNLIFFTIVSVLLESFLRMKHQWMKIGMFWWYFLPLYIVPILVAVPLGGFGLSLSIEIMTWSLWAYIVSNYKEFITNKINTFLVVLAGIPSYVFVSWLVPFLFGSFNNDPYDASEAFLHIVFGVVSGLGVLLVVYLTRNKTEISDISQAGENQ